MRGSDKLAALVPLAVLGIIVGMLSANAAVPASGQAMRSGEGNYIVDGSAIRPEPNRSKAPVGYGYVPHQIDMHCAAYGENINGRSDWYFHTDVTTGATGWTHGSAVDPFSDYLPNC